MLHEGRETCQLGRYAQMVQMKNRWILWLIVGGPFLVYFIGKLLTRVM